MGQGIVTNISRLGHKARVNLCSYILLPGPSFWFPKTAPKICAKMWEQNGPKLRKQLAFQSGFSDKKMPNLEQFQLYGSLRVGEKLSFPRGISAFLLEFF